jgi:glyceraldehyde-3-phosphate dehydrogenase (ferredoxin)
MVPNQYWTPGVLSPMPIMGKYYMHYGAEFLEPRVLGRVNAGRMKEEFVMDNLGMCRFHRGWAEEMLPEILQSLWGVRDAFKRSLAMTASRINSRNASVFWEPSRNVDFIRTFLKRRVEVENDVAPETAAWLKRFEEDGQEAALSFWFDTLKGIHESLREF